MRVAITLSPSPSKKLLNVYSEPYGELIFMAQWSVLQQAMIKLMNKVQEIVDLDNYCLYPEFNASGMVHGHGWIETRTEEVNDTEYRALLNAINYFAKPIFGAAMKRDRFAERFVAWEVKQEFNDWTKWVEYCEKSQADMERLNSKLKKPLRKLSRSFTATPPPFEVDVAYVDSLVAKNL